MTMDSSSHVRTSLLKGTAIVGSLTLISRVLGFVRDLLFARILGATLVADMFLVAFRIPNTMRAFFAEGALSSAFIPVFAEEVERGQDYALQYYRRALGAMLLIVLFCVFLIFMYSDEVVLLFAGGLSRNPKAVEQTAALLQIMLPYLPSIMIIVLVNGALTTLHRYGAGSVAQILVNVCLIGGSLAATLWEPSHRSYVLAWAVLVAAIVQYAVLFPMAYRLGFPPLPAWPRWSPALARMFWLMIPAVFGAAVYQLTILINTILASFLETGSISWLFYADRIAQLPIGIFTVALSSVLLPQLARSHAQGAHTETMERLAEALRFSVFFLFPLSVGLSLTAEPIISLLFERGEFTARDSLESSAALRWYALGLAPLSLYSVVSRHFIAKKQAAIPALIGLCVLTSSLFISLSLMGSIQTIEDSLLSTSIERLQAVLPWRMELGHEGLAISSALAALLSLLLSLLVLPQKERITIIQTLSSGLRILPATIAIASVCLVINGMHLSNYLHLLIIFPTCLMAFILFGKLFKSRELEETFFLSRRYLSRKNF